ncbi:MAG: hypothetical protein WED00_12335 [Aquisalimonadaceae bacterium]
MNIRTYRWAGPYPLDANVIAETTVDYDDQPVIYRYESDGGGGLIRVSGTSARAAIETDLDELATQPIDFATDQDIYQILALALVRAAPLPEWQTLSAEARAGSGLIECLCVAKGEEQRFSLKQADDPVVGQALAVLTELVKRSGGGSWSTIQFFVRDDGRFELTPIQVSNCRHSTRTDT